MWNKPLCEPWCESWCIVFSVSYIFKSVLRRLIWSKLFANFEILIIHLNNPGSAPAEKMPRLTHCILNRLSHTIYWENPISILGTSGYEIYIFLEENGKTILQTVETLIRRRVLRRLIWVCTVCQLPFYGSPDYNGLNVVWHKQCLIWFRKKKKKKKKKSQLGIKFLFLNLA